MGLWSLVGKLIGITAKAGAKATVEVGKVAAKGTVKLAEAVYDRREQIGKAAVTVAETTATATAVVGYGAYKAAEWTAQKVYDHREEIGGAVHGAAVGTAGAVADASGHLISLKPRLERLDAQSAEYRRRTSAQWDRLRRANSHVSRRDVLLDILAVGGATLSSYADGSSQTPPNVEAAFRAAYPDLAQSEDFASAVRRMDTDELQGLASGVKGKLFEIEYVDFLNDGNLPQGYTAQIAGSATQPGWDIQVLGPDAGVVEQIQAKATDSVSYVTEALQRYPEFDVVTTSEVHAELVLNGLADRVTDGGFSEAALQSTIDSSADAASLQFDWVPSSIAVALIAFSSYSKEGLDAYAKSKNFGERTSKSYLAYLAGGALAVTTQTWWLAVVGSVGSRLLIDGGRRKWDRKAQLDELIATNERILARRPQ